MARLVQLEPTAARVKMILSVQTVSMMTLLLITITSYLSLSRIYSVTPHIAFFTDQAVSDMVESSVKSVVQFAAGEDTPLEVH